jgi:hypothetical protein
MFVYRNGETENHLQHRKDFILKVQECDIVEADLPDKIVQCKDSIVHFENGSASSAITSYLWEFGDNTSNRSSANRGRLSIMQIQEDIWPGLQLPARKVV